MRNSLKHTKRGLTLIELLISMVGAGILLAVVFPLVISTRQIYSLDNSRTSMLQNLRTVMDLMGAEVRQAGQGMSSVPSVPAIVLTTVSGKSSLEVVRAISEDTLTNCEQLSQGNIFSITIGLAAPDPNAFTGCALPGQSSGLNSWTDYLSRNNNKGVIYIFDRASATGDFLEISSINTTSTRITLRVDGRLSQNYSIVQQPIIFLVETRKFQLNSNDILEMIRDRNVAIEKVAPNITKLSIRACLAVDASFDCTNWASAFSPSTSVSWQSVRSLEISLSSEADAGNSSKITRELTSRFLPRNTF